MIQVRIYDCLTNGQISSQYSVKLAQYLQYCVYIKRNFVAREPARPLASLKKLASMDGMIWKEGMAETKTGDYRD